MTKILSHLLILLSALCCAVPVWAEKADRDKPIYLEADNVTIDDAKKTSTYTGRVIVTQGTLEIRADKMVVVEDARGNKEGTTYGNPTTFRQKQDGKNEYITGAGQRIEYSGEHMDKVRLYVNAEVHRGKDVVRGDYIMYDGASEYAEAFGVDPKSPGGAAAKTGGRVRAVIQPKARTAVEPDTTEKSP